MKYVIIIFLLAAALLKAQTVPTPGGYLKNSQDVQAQKLFTDLYECFESDEGVKSPQMTQAYLTLLRKAGDPTVPNNALYSLLKTYYASVSQPDSALRVLNSLEAEYKATYGGEHPLILLHRGESLINAGRNKEAFDLFLEFSKTYKNSILTTIYLYQTTDDAGVALSLLSVVKGTRPKHWIVRQLKDRTQKQ
jgi:hypothetical protein